MSSAHGGCLLAVQETNDSSIASKLSMCEKGYFNDPFLKYFVSKAVRRSSLINRGYYIRVKALSTVITTFIDRNHRGAQVLSLGAGFDTTYFRLQKEGKVSSCKYFEVDYPEVIFRKTSVLQKVPQYQHLMQRKFDETHNLEVIYIGNYVTFGCDITDIKKLEYLLCFSGVDPKLPTLLIAECVLSYIEPSRVDCLLHWCAKYFPSAVFCTYEQVNPNDRFGQVMREHFVLRGSPLKGLSKYSDIESHEKRYIEAGWEKTVCCNMNEFYMSLPSSERLRVESLELFDEYEEWHLKCNHYIILCSAVGESVSVLNSFPFSHIFSQCDLSSSKLSLSSFGLAKIGRYAHCSVQRSDGEVIVYGGFGSSPTTGVHSRLNSMIGVTFCDSQLQVRNIQLCGDEECKPDSLMHHKVVLLPCGDMLMYGGRTSPKKANTNFYHCSLYADKMTVKKLHLSTHIPGRWRHTMTFLFMNGKNFVVIIGGCSDTSDALDDCYIISIEESSLKVVSSITMPKGLHSHSAILYNEGVLIVGGLDSSMIPQSTILYLEPNFGENKLEWSLSSIEFTPQLPARYGAASIVQDNIAWVIGGVSMPKGPEVLMLNLINHTWQGYDFLPPVTKLHPLLINCSVHLHSRKELLIIGGGGNLFSFGTCINHLATVINLEV